MKILLVSTFDKRGGAAVAVDRLYKALKMQGVEVKVLTFFGASDQEDRINLSSHFWKKCWFWVLFCLERLKVLFIVSKRGYLFKYSFGKSGLNISKIRQVQEADLLHFHWISLGFISIASIAELSTQKPVLWTVHDFWPFTGGCHLPFHCQEFRNSCLSCHYLKGKSLVSHKNWEYKRKLLESKTINFGTVSNWQLEQLRSSSILRNSKSSYLGNPLDLDLYRPSNKSRSDLLTSKGLDPTKFYLAFGAPKLKDDAKGVQFLIDAVKLSGRLRTPIHLLIFGEPNTESLSQLPQERTLLGTINSEKEMAEVYQTADCFIQTSLQETLSYTVMESMACGTPVVAFDSGGVSDMIEHKTNGYLTELKDVQGLVKGIQFVMDQSENHNLGANARAKIQSLFDQETVVQRHLEVYNEIIT